MRFERADDLPERRKIEIADVEVVAAEEPAVAWVEREPYLASQELHDAVNLAIALGRPLLVQGDPGAGKTCLAYAIAYALELPLEEAYIKSTSQGRDLLYTYDAVRRLYDVQIHGGEQYDAARYVRLGPLGRAIARAELGRRSVVLIDEIDKADIDFPNDLLRELDRLAFEVTEVPRMRYQVPEGRPELRPIIVVTNNEEKSLPGAFLRRCIFHYVEFPTDPTDLDRILDLHGIAQKGLRTQAIETLLGLREMDLAKKPGMSELLDWVSYLQKVPAPNDESGVPPYRGALVKQRSDLVRLSGARSAP